MLKPVAPSLLQRRLTNPVPVVDIELQLGCLPLHALIVVDAEGEQLQLLDQLFLHVRGGTKDEGVTGLLVVERHLLDDLGVRDDLWEQLRQTVEHWHGEVVGGHKVTERSLGLECSIFNLLLFAQLAFSILQRLLDCLNTHSILSILFLLLCIASVQHILVMFLQIPNSLVTQKFLFTVTALHFVGLARHRIDPGKLASPDLFPLTASHSLNSSDPSKSLYKASGKINM